MKKWFLALAALFTLHAQATVITLDVADPTINVGETTTVTVSGIFEQGFDSFDFDLLYDTFGLAVVDGSFASDFEANPFNIFYAFAPGVGLSGDYFESYSGAVTLFTFDITGLEVGTYDISLWIYELFDAVEDPTTLDIDLVDVNVDSIEAARINVVEASAPQTISLMALAIGMFMWRRRQA